MTRHLFASLMILGLAALPASMADANGPSGFMSGAAHRAVAPDYHDVERDGPVYMARDLNGAMWAAWSYASGSNVDVAVSSVSGSTWTHPMLVGAGNNVRDLDPRLAFFADGTAMLVWWQDMQGDAPNRVMASRLTSAGWSSPESVSPDLVSARSPSFFEAESANPLIGFVVENPDGTSGIVTVPAGPTPNSLGGTNGPDPIPTIGDGEHGEESGWTPRPRARGNDNKGD